MNKKFIIIFIYESIECMLVEIKHALMCCIRFDAEYGFRGFAIKLNIIIEQQPWLYSSQINMISHQLCKTAIFFEFY